MAKAAKISNSTLCRLELDQINFNTNYFNRLIGAFQTLGISTYGLKGSLRV